MAVARELRQAEEEARRHTDGRLVFFTLAPGRHTYSVQQTKIKISTYNSRGRPRPKFTTMVIRC